ncbi:PREDICTED: probable BOI-related E3 ubiquitin-protein ligase 3 [Ipomoea nil]|uniref:probable BOI-related E3 ubiquitin-protein ligase 3 n=1 Tax=Ipomoea nil TaxID=35883 RepID=UPI000901965E|nr:PREDICTED: probable BOI-related E3 ubiquitin-protein ligase 3 [Ipomoea nil]
MAIQAQIYSQNLGFPLAIPPDFMDGDAPASAAAAVDGVVGFDHHFCFNPPPPPLPPQQQFVMPQFHQNIPPQQQKNYNDFVAAKNPQPPSMGFSQNLAAELEKQILEIDRFISLQNERLRLGLQEQRKQQLALMLRKYESKKQFLLKQKEEEMSKALNKTMELEDMLRRIEMEKQAWQSMAKEKEAMAMSLNNTIEQLKESAWLQPWTGGAEDAESCCENGGDDNAPAAAAPLFRDGGSGGGNGENSKRGDMACKSCNSGVSCVVFLPCRHLSSCQACDPFLDSCPLCGMLKKASIQALL